MRWLSPEQIEVTDPVGLGMGGFCFLVAELLAGRHASAQVWRLTHRGEDDYRHVFVRVDGRPCDVKGFRGVSEMLFDLADGGLVEEVVSPEELRAYFYPRYSGAQLAAARRVLERFLDRQHGAFDLCGKWGGKVCALAFALFMSVGSVSGDVRYSITDLGDFGSAGSEALGLNNVGQVVGDASLASGGWRAFLYSGGSMADLGSLGGAWSWAYGINDSGVAVGGAQTAGGAEHACRFVGGSVQDLGTLGGSYSRAYAINGSGQIAGYAQPSSGGWRAFLYSGGVIRNLGTLGGSTSYAYGLNAGGQVVGESTTSASKWRAFRYSGGVMQDLGTLGGNNSHAYAINNSGQVVGQADLPAGSWWHAFLYSGGVMSDLGTLGGDTSYAYGINNSGVVVGYSAIPSSAFTHAFIYSDGRMTDLHSLTATNSGWILEYAKAINDQGMIVGQGLNPSGQTRAFLLTPLAGPVRPALGIAPSGGNVIISWTTNSEGFGLFQNTGCVASGWLTVTDAVTLSNGQNRVVTSGLRAGVRFYRLQSQ